MSELNEGMEIDFIKLVVNKLVEHPEEVKIEKVIDSMGVLINLQLHKDDMGKVIGKNGQTIKSIRTLLRVIGSKQNARITLKILEPLE